MGSTRRVESALQTTVSNSFAEHHGTLRGSINSPELSTSWATTGCYNMEKILKNT
ncbi:unnamed protein product, partial [Didymodactylos carnosus]